MDTEKNGNAVHDRVREEAAPGQILLHALAFSDVQRDDDVLVCRPLHVQGSCIEQEGNQASVGPFPVLDLHGFPRVGRVVETASRRLEGFVAGVAHAGALSPQLGGGTLEDPGESLVHLEVVAVLERGDADGRGIQDGLQGGFAPPEGLLDLEPFLDFFFHPLAPFPLAADGAEEGEAEESEHQEPCGQAEGQELSLGLQGLAREIARSDEDAQFGQGPEEGETLLAASGPGIRKPAGDEDPLGLDAEALDHLLKM